MASVHQQDLFICRHIRIKAVTHDIEALQAIVVHLMLFNAYLWNFCRITLQGHIIVLMYLPFQEICRGCILSTVTSKQTNCQNRLQNLYYVPHKSLIVLTIIILTEEFFSVQRVVSVFSEICSWLPFQDEKFILFRVIVCV